MINADLKRRGVVFGLLIRTVIILKLLYILRALTLLRYINLFVIFILKMKNVKIYLNFL